MRTPIALPVTSLEGAKVISDAGTTSKGKELVLSVVRKKTSDTHAREQSETLTNGREVSAPTNTNTNILAQIQILQQELAQTKAENIVFKAKWRNNLLLSPLSRLSWNNSRMRFRTSEQV